MPSLPDRLPDVSMLIKAPGMDQVSQKKCFWPSMAAADLQGGAQQVGGEGLGACMPPQAALHQARLPPQGCEVHAAHTALPLQGRAHALHLGLQPRGEYSQGQVALQALWLL